MQYLDRDCQCYIFSFLSVRDGISIQLTCKDFEFVNQFVRDENSQIYQQYWKDQTLNFLQVKISSYQDLVNQSHNVDDNLKTTTTSCGKWRRFFNNRSLILQEKLKMIELSSQWKHKKHFYSMKILKGIVNYEWYFMCRKLISHAFEILSLKEVHEIIFERIYRDRFTRRLPVCVEYMLDCFIKYFDLHPNEYRRAIQQSNQHFYYKLLGNGEVSRTVQYLEHVPYFVLTPGMCSTFIHTLKTLDLDHWRILMRNIDLTLNWSVLAQNFNMLKALSEVYDRRGGSSDRTFLKYLTSLYKEPDAIVQLDHPAVVEYLRNHARVSFLLKHVAEYSYLEEILVERIIRKDPIHVDQMDGFKTFSYLKLLLERTNLDIYSHSCVIQYLRGLICVNKCDKLEEVVKLLQRTRGETALKAHILKFDDYFCLTWIRNHGMNYLRFFNTLHEYTDYRIGVRVLFEMSKQHLPTYKQTTQIQISKLMEKCIIGEPTTTVSAIATTPPKQMLFKEWIDNNLELIKKRIAQVEDWTILVANSTTDCFSVDGMCFIAYKLSCEGVISITSK